MSQKRKKQSPYAISHHCHQQGYTKIQISELHEKQSNNRRINLGIERGN